VSEPLVDFSIEDALVKDVTTQLLFLAYTTKLKQY
jgi:hypothetical protein